MEVFEGVGRLKKSQRRNSRTGERGTRKTQGQYFEGKETKQVSPFSQKKVFLVVFATTQLAFQYWKVKKLEMESWKS